VRVPAVVRWPGHVLHITPFLFTLSDSYSQVRVPAVVRWPGHVLHITPFLFTPSDSYSQVRVPAVVRWPGHVPVGITITAVASLLDVFPTFISLAGGTPRGSASKIIDGVDISQLLTSRALPPPPPTTARSASTSTREPPSVFEIFDRGRCLFFYGGTPGSGCTGATQAERIRACPGLWAVRCGAYKRHFVTREGQRVNPAVQRDGVPLVFQLEHDPGEAYPLAHQGLNTLQAMDAAIARHLESLPGESISLSLYIYIYIYIYICID